MGIAATAPSRAAYSEPKVGHSRLRGMFLLLILSATALAAWRGRVLRQSAVDPVALVDGPVTNSSYTLSSLSR